MTLSLYDSFSRTQKPMKPLRDNTFRMYLCGATVQGLPHVGHMRSSLVFDVLRNWLEYLGYSVEMIRNVTDIDDKILHTAVHENRPWWAVAAHYEREFQSAYAALGCKVPTAEPRATGHITHIIELIERLIERGHAYESEGDVYFDVRSFSKYGALTRQNPDDMESSADSEHESKKRDIRDFALWKNSKVNEPSWPSPWGRGRPGWHIECSAMAHAYLGERFDIHGGGLDLMFPHHENEIAQSNAAGYEFASTWLHNSWVTQAGEKMSKSLGNSLVVRDVLERVNPIELRWYLLSAHYRSNLEFSDDAMFDQSAAFRRIQGFVSRASSLVGEVETSDVVVDAAFAAAMNNDLSLPEAYAVLHETVSEGNTAITAGNSERVLQTLRQVRKMLSIIGVDPLAWKQTSKDSDDLKIVVDHLVSSKIVERAQAREHKDWAKADQIRDELQRAGIELDDTADGTRWNVSKDTDGR